MLGSAGRRTERAGNGASRAYTIGCACRHWRLAGAVSGNQAHRSSGHVRRVQHRNRDRLLRGRAEFSCHDSVAVLAASEESVLAASGQMSAAGTTRERRHPQTSNARVKNRARTRISLRQRSAAPAGRDRLCQNQHALLPSRRDRARQPRSVTRRRPPRPPCRSASGPPSPCPRGARPAPASCRAPAVTPVPPRRR